MNKYEREIVNCIEEEKEDKLIGVGDIKSVEEVLDNKCKFEVDLYFNVFGSGVKIACVILREEKNTEILIEVNKKNSGELLKKWRLNADIERMKEDIIYGLKNLAVYEDFDNDFDYVVFDLLEIEIFDQDDDLYFKVKNNLRNSYYDIKFKKEYKKLHK